MKQRQKHRMPISNRRRLRRFSLPAFTGKLRLGAFLALTAVLLAALALLLRPSAQLLSSPEISRAQRLGVLRAGVRTDVPGFSMDGDGLELRLARALTSRIFPDNDPDIMLELVPVTAYTALDKLKSDDIDITFSLQRDLNSADYMYSEPYYFDRVLLLTRTGEERRPLSGETIALIPKTAGEQAYQAYIQADKDGAGLSFRAYASYPDMLAALLLGRENFIAVPGAYASPLIANGVSVHEKVLGEVGYVAVSSAGSSAFAMLAGIVIEELEKSGELKAWAQELGLP